jgi:ABC-type nitrate/sulfonate/bicarbonate transport system substrate-binding protein
MTRRLAVGALAFAGALLCTAAQASASPSVRVLLPDSDNLQYLAFWVAQGAGYFEAEGVRVELVVPEVPAQAIAWMSANKAPVAVLPPPVYLQLVADHFPLRLVANLLRNDPIDLVVRRSTFDARHMDATAPLRDRLNSLHGLRVGVAPGPPTRLRVLFASVGLDADRDVEMVVRRGPDQNAAFANGECDALYAHTPYLEHALDDQQAVMLVNQSAGEVAELAMRQIHALVVRDDFLALERPVVVALVRAIARAEGLVHRDLAATEDAVMHAIPSMDRRHLHTLLGIYQAAVPEEPNVTTEGLAPALALFPASHPAPSLEGVRLADFIAPDLDSPGKSPSAVAVVAASTSRSARSQGLWAALFVALGTALVALTAVHIAISRRRPRSRTPKG